MPWPSKSTAIVSLDRVVAERFDGEVDGGPDRSVDAVDAPGFGWVDVGESEVDDRLAPPMRRVVRHRAPTWGLPVWSMCPSTTPFCHSLNRVGSVA